MFNFLKKLFVKNESPKLEEIEKKTIINVIKDCNTTQINILENCSLEEFVNQCKEFNIDEEKIPMRIYIKINNDNFKFSVQDIFVYKRNNTTYFVSKTDSQLIISQQKTIDDRIEEISISMFKHIKNYKITKYIHTLDHSTKSVKWFPQDNQQREMFTLNKKEAFFSLYKLLDDIVGDCVDNLIINPSTLYNYFHLTRKSDYFPVISNDIITLSWPCRFNETDINKRDYEFFNIILNDTKQTIGQISFNYKNSGFSYGGNVSYHIEEEFRGNHYATQALDLLKQLLKENLFSGDKDLYIATTPENYKSQKVILNNNGELFYKGKVPEDDSINFIDGVKNVCVYRIKM